MKRILSILLCLVTLTTLLAGCVPDDDPSAYVPTGDALTTDDHVQVTTPVDEGEQEFSLAYYAKRSLNPLECDDYTNRLLMPLIYQSLFAVNRDHEVIPILCKSYAVSKDLKTYDITLDPKATFSDGTPVTAADAEASLLKAKRSGYYSGRLQYVQSITVKENGSLRIRLSKPCEELPLLLDIPIIKASELEEARPLGSGPYVWKREDKNYVLSRRGNWWCQSPDLQVTALQIPLKKATSNTDIRDSFEFENVGVVCTDPGSDRYVEYRCDYELWDCETGTFVFLGINKESEIFKKQEVRQAISKGINRVALVDAYYRGFAMATELPAPPNSEYYNPVLAQRYAYDKDAFESVMSQYKGRTITLLVNKSDSLRVKVAQRIGRMLSTSGLVVDVVKLSTSNYKAALRAGEYDLYLGQTKLSPNMDLSEFFAEDGNLNYGGMDSVANYKLCLQALENKGNYYTLHYTIMEEAYLCPILFRSYAIYAARGLLTKLQPARDNLFCYSIGRTLEDAYRISEE